MSILATLGAIKNLIPDGRKHPEKIDVSNLSLKLYRLTFLVLLAFSILTTGKQFFGEPIHCERAGSVDKAVFESYCWIHGTFAAPRKPDPAAGTLRYNLIEDRKRYQNYYQWMCFIFFFQALLCYLPYKLWKILEGGVVERLVKIANVAPVFDEFRDPDLTALSRLSRIISRRRGTHSKYAAKFILCQILAVFSVWTQLYFMNSLLGGDFATLGPDILAKSDDNYSDFDKNPILRIFPKLVQCIFVWKIGASGTTENHSAICILPINILNEKIFVFLWFWYVVLAAYASVDFLVNVLTFLCPLPRLFFIRLFVSSSSPDSKAQAYCMKKLAKCVDFGDYFLLFQLQRNLDPGSFGILLEELAHLITSNDPHCSMTLEFPRTRIPGNGSSPVFSSCDTKSRNSDLNCAGDGNNNEKKGVDASSIASNRISRV